MRQPFAPTDEQRQAVRAARAEGRGQAEIATLVRVSLPTLRKYFRDELGAKPVSAPSGLALFDAAPKTTPTHANPSTARPPGRPAHVPTQLERERVEVSIASGMKQREIALALGISEPTLREAYAIEIETGAARKKFEALNMLYKAAKAGNVAAIKELNAKIVDAELTRLGGDVVAPPPAKKEDSPGKKAAALTEAHEVLTGPGKWAQLLGDAQGSA